MHSDNGENLDGRKCRTGSRGDFGQVVLEVAEADAMPEKGSARGRGRDTRSQGLGVVSKLSFHLLLRVWTLMEKVTGKAGT
jgi:hypothetical protein